MKRRSGRAGDGKARAETELNFGMGAKDGTPIALGYFAVALTFGVTFVARGYTVWQTFLTSLTNFTGVGQFTGLALIAEGAAFAELALAMFVVSIRYALMSVTIGQRLSPRVTFAQRFAIAFGMTDENFAVAVGRNRPVTFSYWAGVSLVAYSGWLIGTLIGSLAGGILPESVQTAFGIAIHAMFVAILVPPCKKSLPMLFAVATAAGLSCLFWYTPVLNALSKGWATVVVGIVCAVICALIFPVRNAAPENSGEVGSQAPNAESEEAEERDV